MLINGNDNLYLQIWRYSFFMQKIIGKYASADVFSDDVEQYALAQIKYVCDNQAAEGSKIKVMPDVHPGKVCPIGFTMTIANTIMPALVGDDIGCGISYIKFKKTHIEFEKLNKVIRESIPSGMNVRKKFHHYSFDFNFDNLLCKKHINVDKSRLSLGTLGSGNHFIEVGKDQEDDIYAFVHTGSRSLGKAVAEHYMKLGQKELKKNGIETPYELTYLKGELMEEYIHDLKEVQGFAMLNREIILSELSKNMKWKVEKFGESIHNYLYESNILRKGATNAYYDDEVIIPINSRDGIIIGTGKGNSQWNYSAPHGSGRTSNRKDVLNSYTVAQYKESMKDVYSPSICKETLDEAPFAYRGIKEILDAIQPSVEIRKIIKPVYSYKAIERRK